MSIDSIEGSSPTHQLIWSVSPPRSCSTAWTRMMAARKDFAIFHENATSPWILENYGREVWAQWFREEAPTSYNQLTETLFSTLHKTNVFVKEMIVPTLDLFKHKPHLMQDNDIQFVFLLRHPHACLVSYYNVCKANKGRPNLDSFENFLGYSAMWELYQKILEHNNKPPIVIRAEHLCDKTEEVVRTFCAAVNIPFIEESLSWKSEQANSSSLATTLNHTFKELEICPIAYGEAMKSTGLHELTTYEKDEQNNPTFSEIDALDRPQVLDIYTRCLEVYHRFFPPINGMASTTT